MENKQQMICYISFACNGTLFCFQVIFAILKHIVACPNLKVEGNTWIIDFIS